MTNDGGEQPRSAIKIRKHQDQLSPSESIGDVFVFNLIRIVLILTQTEIDLLYFCVSNLRYIGVLESESEG